MGIRAAVRLALFGALFGVLGLAAASAQSVTIAPASISVPIGAYYRFSAAVTGITPTTVGWSVSLPAGDTGSPGTIDTGGLFIPPAAMPSGGTVIVKVASNVNAAISATATVTLLNPHPMVASVSPAHIPLGPFTLTVNGSSFVQGAVVMLGSTIMPTTYVSSTRLTATGTATLAQMGTTMPVTVVNPDPGSMGSLSSVSVMYGNTDGPPTIPYPAAARFLDQAAWGGDAATIAHVQSVGFANYLKEQFSAPMSPYPDPTDTAYYLGGVQARFFSNAVHGQDQLRQRVAFALMNIFVVSAITDNTAPQIIPYLQILQKDAFANFRVVMEDVSLSPTMGLYLNMVNNDKANATTGTAANENYARELMQLFTIGLSQLNADGTPQHDASGNLIPTYDQATISQFAKIYTGWTYPTQPGATLKIHNPQYYVGPMVPFAANHDTTSKTLLNGVVVPAGQTAQQDLKAALDNIFAHQNVAPFISKQLIEHLVTSNPSPAYVARISAVFNDDGTGTKGNLAAVVTAILMDPEARAGDNGASSEPATGGKLREPVLFVTSMLRGLGAVVNDSNGLTGYSTNLGQQLLFPPSVFNYFSPLFVISPTLTGGARLGGPEFQLESPSNAVGRANTVNSFIFGNLGAGAVIDLTPFANLGNNMNALYNAISNAFFYGQMPVEVQNAMQTATSAIPGTTAAAAKSRAQAALYIALSSSYYNVEH